MRRQRFAALSTVGPSGGPQTTGVVYAVSPPVAPVTLYVTTRRPTAKVRNILAASQVGFVIPVPHRLLAVVPPAVVQFRGFADILDAERRLVAEREEMCFIAIRPHSTVFTYRIGMSALDAVRRPRQAIGEVRLPTGR